MFNQELAFETFSDTTLRTKDDYQAVFNYVRDVLTSDGGNLKKDDSTSRILEAAWRHGINAFGLRVTVQFRTLSDNQIELHVKGGFADAIDTTGAGAKKAREIAAIIDGRNSQTGGAMMPPRIGDSNIQNRGKKKSVAGILAILLGGVGAHKFYLGNWGLGICYIISLFVIPYASALLGAIEGIRLLMLNDSEFDEKYNYQEIKPFQFVW